MLYPDDIEQKLGFDQIRDKIKAHCLCTLGTSRVDSMAFTADALRIQELLDETQEFAQILETNQPFPVAHFIDVTKLLETVAIDGACIEPADAVLLVRSLETVLLARDFLVKYKDTYPRLQAHAASVQLSKSVVQRVYEVVDEQGKVKDTASEELKLIRKKLQREQARLRKQIDQAFRFAADQNWVPEGALPTIRQGRLVIPVMAEYKRKFKGFILDESATGQTVFIEPADAMEANNEIRDLEHAEHREIIRLLKALTSYLRQHLQDLNSAYRFLAHIDFTRARALFAIDIDAHLPEIQNFPALKWMNARHPLLYLGAIGKRNVVPLQIELTAAERMLLVSGPNAGGKSVCLKTVGLLQYMLQCGLLIPVLPDSTAGLFDDIFIDIGDQQSIENDLSTYSSHLGNLAVFLQHAGGRSLVLLDELGSGTDPNVGGAIAQAVLKSLLDKKVWLVATTHYNNLKVFADQHEGIRNGAMRFDEENLKPLYILDIGKPGSSFALEIARKTGIPPDVLMQAEEMIGPDLTGFEKITRTLEQEYNELKARLQKLGHQERIVNETREKVEKQAEELEHRKNEILNKAKHEAAALLQQANREIEKTIRHIRENQAQRSETVKARKHLQQLAGQIMIERKETLKAELPQLAVGDRVRIEGQQGSGTILSIKGKQARVQFGEIKSNVALAKLEKLFGNPEPDVPAKTSVPGLRLYEKQAVFNPVLDVRGKRAEEVIPLLDQFLDNALLLGHSELKILHGKGEGILRSVVRTELLKNRHVQSFADEHVERGGAGITVVVLN